LTRREEATSENESDDGVKKKGGEKSNQNTAEMALYSASFHGNPHDQDLTDDLYPGHPSHKQPRLENVESAWDEDRQKNGDVAWSRVQGGL